MAVRVLLIDGHDRRSLAAVRSLGAERENMRYLLDLLVESIPLDSAGFVAALSAIQILILEKGHLLNFSVAM